MGYYRFALDQPKRTHFSEFAPPPEVRDQLWLDLYLGRPAAVSSPLVFSRVIRGGGRPEPLRDRLHTTIAPLLISQRLYSVLMPFLDEAQVIEARVEHNGSLESADYVCLNVQSVVDCFDFRGSTYLVRIKDRTGTHRQVRYGNPLTRWYVRLRFPGLLSGGYEIGYVYEPVLRGERIPSGLNVFRVRGIEGQFLFVSAAVRDRALSSGCTGLAFEPTKVRE